MDLFDSRIIRRMMCESMLSTNAEIAPMHCCLGEPDCLAGIMLLFQTDWAVVSVSILALLYKSQLCLLLIFTSRHDESLAIMSDHCRITLNSGPFLGRDIGIFGLIFGLI